MPRALTGRIIERRLHDDTLAFDVVIRGRQVLVGYAPEWSHSRVKALLDTTLVPLAKLRKPWWEELRDEFGASSVVASTDPNIITFREVASETVLRLQGKYSVKATLNAYLSPIMKHVGPFFSYDGERDRTVSEINGALVSAFTKAKMHEREVLQDLADTLAETDDSVLRDPEALRKELDTDEEWDLLVRYGQRGGRHPLAEALTSDARGKISLSSRGLSNNEINRCLARLRDILDTAREDFKIDIGDPTRKRSLPRVDPPRSWLRPVHVQAIFDAAQELDARDTPDDGSDHRPLGRYGLVVLLALGGPRVSEAGAAEWPDAHLKGELPYLDIAAAKTSAGVRQLRLHPFVRDVLAARKAALGPEAVGYIFATSTGRRRDRNSVRQRLEPILRRAAELLAKRKQPPLPRRVTPHTFRRTYLTFLAWAGVPLRRAMSQAGQKDAKVTLEVYQQDFPDDPVGLAQVKAWLSVDD